MRGAGEGPDDDVFFIIVIVTFGLGSLLNRVVTDYVIDTTSDLYSWAYLLILVLPILFFVAHFRYPLSTFGVRREQWAASLRDGLVSGALGVALFLWGYWLVRRLLGDPVEHNLLVVSDARLLSSTVETSVKVLEGGPAGDADGPVNEEWVP